MPEDRPASTARRRDTRSRFDRFVEVAHHHVSRPAAFAVAIAVIVLWALSYPAFHHIAEWHAVIHTTASITTLLVLVLLENAGRRADEGAQEKLNLVCEALSVLLDERADAAVSDEEARRTLRDEAGRLRDAIGLDERH